MITRNFKVCLNAGVALTLQDEQGTIILNEHFDTEYTAE